MTADPKQDPATKILIVDDVASIRVTIVEYMRASGYRAEEASSFATARRALKALKPDIVVLDLGLGDGDGRDLIDEINGAGAAAIIVSSRTEPSARIECLELGAHDYMTKPIELRELLLRIRRTVDYLQVSRARNASVWSAHGIKVDHARRVIMPTAGRKTVPITTNEFALLRYLASRPNQICERLELAKRAGIGMLGEDSRAIDVAMSRLRKKLQEAGYALQIRSKRGAGYLMETPNDPEGSGPDDPGRSTQNIAKNST